MSTLLKRKITMLTLTQFLEAVKDLKGDEKPLLKWHASLEKELKKLGVSYDKSVKPEDALELYYAKKNPKASAKVLAKKAKK